MKLRDDVMLGLLLAVGSMQFMIVMMLAEAVAPGYSMHDNAISDLGVSSATRWFFNPSLFAIGLLNLIAGYFFLRVYGDRRVMAIFFAGGIGAMGAGLVSLDSPFGVHGVFAFAAFLFLNLEAILCARVIKGPLRIISGVFGIVGLVFLAVMFLVDSGLIDASSSIGHGAVERLIAFPALIWMILYGGYLLQSRDLPAATKIGGGAPGVRGPSTQIERTAPLPG